MTRRRTFLSLCFALVIGAAMITQPALAQDKPNIIVIWGDDIGRTNLSIYTDGMMGYRTSNIDRIANELAGQFVVLGTSVSAEPVPYSASGEAPGLQPETYPASTQRTPQVEDSRAEEWRERRRQKGQEIARNLYGSWIDEDGDCQNTRQEVLIAESLVPVELDSRGCRVVSGAWLDPFTGQTFTDPSDLDIAHFIPLAEAHRSGADRWAPQHRQDFANDLSFPGSLIAVSASANRSKGDRDPAGWLPPNQDFHCEYVRTWIIAKAYWGLTMDDVERSTVFSILGLCESSTRGWHINSCQQR